MYNVHAACGNSKLVFILYYSLGFTEYLQHKTQINLPISTALISDIKTVV